VTHTLVVVRHAKSDWSTPVSDHERPLAARGRRQAPDLGRWMASHLDPLDLAVVSTATRARQTWDLIAAALPAAPPVRLEREAYTFSGYVLEDVVARLPEDARTVALVGHNPAVEELVEILTGDWVRMPTSSLAVVALQAWGARTGTVLLAGRPSDGTLGTWRP
jgi:phosphohistidine phosphatase